MPAAQIYSVVNSLAANIGYTGSNVIDVSSFVAFGQAVLSDTLLTEGVYSTLVDRIGKTVIRMDEAEDEGRGIVVDAFEYGSILQKLSFQLQSAEASSEWDPAHPESPYDETAKTGIVQQFFEQYIPAFSYKDVSHYDQLKEAFVSPASLQGFIDALYTRMYNAYKLAKQGLSDAAIGGLMAAIMADCAPTGGGHTQNVNAPRRVRYLLGEYNTLFSKSLTSANSYQDADYLDWVRKQIIIDQKNIMKMNKLYNNGTVERRTSDVRLDLSVRLTASYDKYYGDTYNDTYVKLPKHNEIVNWGIATDPEKVKVKLTSAGDAITISNILGFMYDPNAVVGTLDKVRFVSFPDSWNNRTCMKLTAERRYVADISENAIIYLNEAAPA